jgi:acetylornithine deacetylase
MTSHENAVADYIDDHREDIVQFLCELIGYQSIHPLENEYGRELEAQKWLRDRLETFGFSKVDFWAVDEKSLRPNVVGTLKGKGGGKALIYNGHCDVVPVSESERTRWKRDPWNAVVEDGNVYGRGASDMKGGLTAMVWAAKALLDTGVQLEGDLLIESVPGEELMEGATIGTTATVERGYRAPFAVIPEPTNCEIHLQSSGAFFFELVIDGKEAHHCARNQVIFPQPYGVPSGEEVGVDAIAKAMPFIELFRRLEVQFNHRWRDQILGGGGYPFHNDQQGIGLFTINICFVDGGTYLGSVPGTCRIKASVWYPGWITGEEVWNEIEQHVRALASTDDWLKKNPPKFSAPVTVHWEPMKGVPPDHEGVVSLSEAYRRITQRESILTGFKAVADSTFLSKAGIPTVLFGPGSIGMAIHGPDEYVPVEQVIRCTKVLALMAMDWCGAV